MAKTEAPGADVPDFGEQYDAVIVGAGIGGLTCGALLAKYGAKVLIVERHTSPGGFVSGFERKGYSFQIPRIVGGCGPNGNVTRLMDYLGIRLDFKRVEPMMRFVYPDLDVSVPSDVDEYAETLKDAFQPQTSNINEYFKTLKSLDGAMDFAMMRRPMSFGTAMRMAAYPFTAPRFLSYMLGKTTYQKMLDKHFSDDRLKSVMSTPWTFMGCPPWELSALAMTGMFNSFSGGAYIPEGGYQAMADAFAKAFTDNGGTLMLGYEATAITTERARVTGVETMPRMKVASEVVVSDIDSKRTFIKLVGRENFSTSFLEKTDELPVSITGLVVHLGMRKRLPDEFAGGPIFVQPSYDQAEMLEEVGVRDRYPDPAKIRWSMMAPSMSDESLAPEGCSSIDITVPAVPYRFMNRWGVEPGGLRGPKYEEIKEKYAELAVRAAGLAFPDLVSDVEAFDVATPVSYERYTMAIDGCWYDSAPTPRQAIAKRPGPRTAVKGLMITGSKTVLGGGIYPSILSGLLTADSAARGAFADLFRR